jgi:hypothetical protein
MRLNNANLSKDPSPLARFGFVIDVRYRLETYVEVVGLSVLVFLSLC